MVVLPAQKRRQQLLLAVLIVALALIFIAWFIGFRILHPGTAPPFSGGDALQPPEEEGGSQNLIAIPRLDWDFIALFGKYKAFEPFGGEFTTTGRKNPFLPY